MIATIVSYILVVPVMLVLMVIEVVKRFADHPAAAAFLIGGYILAQKLVNVSTVSGFRRSAFAIIALTGITHIVIRI